MLKFIFWSLLCINGALFAHDAHLVGRRAQHLGAGAEVTVQETDVHVRFGGDRSHGQLHRPLLSQDPVRGGDHGFDDLVAAPWLRSARVRPL